MRAHLPTFWAGVVLTVFGVAFTLEAAGVWSFTLSQLRVIGPLALIAVGVGVLLGSRQGPRTS